uniref:Zinc ribbon domain containing 2 n=1 Tax=Nothobranchius furzeri TaxID=105023 RepID=A0A8C6LFQ1_NOTFU
TQTLSRNAHPSHQRLSLAGNRNLHCQRKRDGAKHRSLFSRSKHLLLTDFKWCFFVLFGPLVVCPEVEVVTNIIKHNYGYISDCVYSCVCFQTILLQDKQQKNYCVSCQELDSDIDKDNPALNAQAALSQVREQQLAAQSPPPTQASQLNETPCSSSQAGVTVPQPRPEHCEGAAAGGRALLPPPPAPSPSAPVSSPSVAPIRTPVSPQSAALRPVLQEAEEAVLTKLRWATTQLQSSSSLEASIQLCSLITSCASSLRSLKELSQ